MVQGLPREFFFAILRPTYESVRTASKGGASPLQKNTVRGLNRQSQKRLFLQIGKESQSHLPGVEAFDVIRFISAEREMYRPTSDE